MKRFLVSMACAAGVAAGQDLLPRAVPGEGAGDFEFGAARDVHGWAADSSQVVLGRLAALEVTGDGGERPAGRAEGVELRGLTVDDPEALAAELAEWIGRPLTEAGLDRLTEVILRHYDDHDRPMNEVWVPAQDGGGGRLRVEVMEGRIGTVGVGRTRWFNNRLLPRGVRMRKGDLLRGKALQADLDWLSRNPFRSAEMFAAPGEGVSADLIVGIAERRPWRVFAGYDNTGSEAVGENRWFAGFNAGNAFGVDQVLGYQFTRGDSLDDFHAHSLSWEIPLPRCHQFVKISAAWAEVFAVETDGGMRAEAEGSSWGVTAMFGAQLPRAGRWRQEVLGGVEFKRADNFVIFGATTFPGTEVDVVQVRGEWRGAGPLWGGRGRLQASVVASPGEASGRNGSAEFDAFRRGADPTYAYARLEGSWERSFGADWTWRLQGAAQAASGALLPTEQLALGGASTVRGYEERVLLADSACAITAELRSPVWRPEGGAEAGGAGLQGLLFLDHALGWRDGEGGESLTGAGVGARVAFGDNVTGRLDLGWGLEDGEGARLHAGVLVAF